MLADMRDAEPQTCIFQGPVAFGNLHDLTIGGLVRALRFQSFEQLPHVRDDRDCSGCRILRARDIVTAHQDLATVEVTIGPSDILRFAPEESSISQKLDQVGGVAAKPPVYLAHILDDLKKL